MGRKAGRAKARVTTCDNPCRESLESRASCTAGADGAEQKAADPTADSHGHVHNPCRDSYIAELDVEDVKRSKGRGASESNTALMIKVASAIATGVFTVIQLTMQRANETVPCATLTLSPEFDVGDCHSVNAGASCNVYCSLGWRPTTVSSQRVSAQYTCEYPASVVC